jgi:hypothetical protein
VIDYFLGPVGNWFMRATGANSEGGPVYGFWSGFGGAIPDFLILGGIITLYRQHNCAHRPCRKIGRHTTKDGYRLCRVHVAMPVDQLELPAVHEDHR